MRSLEIEQPTDTVIHKNMTVPSVIAVKGEGAFIGKGAKMLRSKMMQNSLARNKSIFTAVKMKWGLRRVYNALEGSESPAHISGLNL